MNTSNARPSRDGRPPLVSVDRCSLTLGQTAVLDRISLEIRRGEFLALVGPSGCGKSTLLRVLLGIAPLLTTGTVRHDVAGARRGIVFQRPVLMPWLTARDNVALCLRIGPDKVRSAAERVDRAARALDAVGLAPFARHYPHELSGGMQQRVAIARAIVAEPSLLLMDEPFGALDEFTRESMNRDILRLWESATVRLETVVLVTHSVAEAVAMADRVVVLTPRPARVVATVEVTLPQPRSEHYPTLAARSDFQAFGATVRARLAAS